MNAIETRTNTHRLTADGTGTVCNPTKLPKGRLFVEGEEYEVTSYRFSTGKVETFTANRGVVCNRCNKVNPGRYR